MPAASRVSQWLSRRGPTHQPGSGPGRTRMTALLASGCVAAGLTLAGPVQHAMAARPVAASRPGSPAETKPTDATRIVAVVNGDVITNHDIDNRTRLFALSTGLPLSPEVLDHLKPQILRQLVDEHLRVQEAQRRKIIIQDQQIADAMRDIEKRNNMQNGALRQKLALDGVSQRTLIDQIRAQLAWSQVLRDAMTEKGAISDAEVAEQQKLQSQLAGQPEYRLGEIFIPVDDPANDADAQRFAETVIAELHQGAAFAMVAAQFSQTQNALEGGEVGWVQSNQLDPAVASLVTQMPVGAISNPVKVPGGFTIVTLQGKRQSGRDVGTVVTVRQAFVPFTTPLDPQAPTDQQRQALAKAHEIVNTVHGCDQMEQFAKANKLDSRPLDPGEIRVDGVNPPAFRQILSTIVIGKPTEPLVSRDGIAVLVVCTREEKDTATVSAQDVQRRLLGERLEMLSRQTMRDLHRQATIDYRGGSA